MSEIKKKGSCEEDLNIFFLFGRQETGLTKAFAYVLADNRSLLFSFLRKLGINKHCSNNNYADIEIRTETVGEKDGRTDIEIELKNRFLIVIEAKIGSNKITNQHDQYLNRLRESKSSKKIMCFITQNKEHLLCSKAEKIDVINFDWYEIYNFLSEYKNDVIVSFLQYLRSCLGNMQKEILMQEVSEETNILLYRQYHIYHRNVVNGNPLYFAPYFTVKAEKDSKDANITRGCSEISRIAGIISCRVDDLPNDDDTLKKLFQSKYEEKNSDSEIFPVESWTEGVKLIQEKYDSNIEQTFFFLKEPVTMNGMKILKKNGRGGEKGWIGSQIPPNKCITFEELFKHLQKDECD